MATGHPVPLQTWQRRCGPWSLSCLWMSRWDVGLDDDMVRVSRARDIAVNLPAYQTALTLHGVESR